MTEPQRRIVRQLIDQAVRAQLPQLADVPCTLACRGCGVPLDSRTPGCRTCRERHYRRRVGRRVYTHGTRTGHANGCRCQSCFEAAQRYWNEQTERRRRERLEQAWHRGRARAQRSGAGLPLTVD